MRIWYLANAASIHTRKWVTFFANRGHDVSLFSYTMPQDAMPNVDMHPLGTSGRRNRVLSYLHERISTLLRLRAFVRRSKPDLVHAHFVTGYGLMGALLGFHPMVVTAWGSDILVGPKESWVLRRIAKYVLKKADLITCDAEHMQDQMIRMGADRRKINIVRFGINTQQFRPQTRTGVGTTDAPTIVSLRDLTPLYDVRSLIECAPFVLAEVPEARFVIAGRGSEEESLKHLAKSLNVFEHTSFVGFIPNSEIPQLLASADVYVSTSLSDAGIAASTAEAMACGLPVVVTDTGENRKWVEDGVNGFVVPARDPRTLAEKIVYLLKNRDTAKSFGATCRQIIVERNDYFKEMTEMEKMYEQLVTRQKERTHSYCRATSC